MNGERDWLYALSQRSPQKLLRMLGKGKVQTHAGSSNPPSLWFARRESARNFPPVSTPLLHIYRYRPYHQRLIKADALPCSGWAAKLLRDSRFSLGVPPCVTCWAEQNRSKKKRGATQVTTNGVRARLPGAPSLGGTRSTQRSCRHQVKTWSPTAKMECQALKVPKRLWNPSNSENCTKQIKNPLDHINYSSNRPSVSAVY